MNRNDGDVLVIDVWWEADCGALHTERNPVVIDYHCLFEGWAGSVEEPPDEHEGDQQ